MSGAFKSEENLIFHMEVKHNHYELIVLLNPSLTSEALESEIEKIKLLLNNEIEFEDRWGLQPIAYPIKKQRKGFYIIFYFAISGDKTKEIEETLRIEKEVLRYLLLRLPKDYTPKKWDMDFPVKWIPLNRKEKKVDEKESIKTMPRKETLVVEEKIMVKEKKKMPEEKEKEETAPETEIPDTETTEPEKKKESKAKTAKPNLEDIDRKLDSIIDNPDISL